MLRVIGILIVATVVMAVAWIIAGLPGHVAISISGYSVETSAPIGILAFLIVVAAILILVRILAALVHIPRGVTRNRERARQRAGERATTRALIALAAGEKSAALRYTAKARRLLGDTPQTLLHAAEAARLNDDEEAAAKFYHMLAEREDAAFIGLRGLFRQAMAREAWPEASLLAKRAEAIRPGTEWLREERATLAVRTGHWLQALHLSGPDAPAAAYATAAAQAAVEHDPGDAMRLAKEAWRDHPGFAPAALAYAGELRKRNKEHRAQAVIRAAWQASPVTDLANFLLAPIDDPLARIREAARMVGDNRDLPESQYLLARLYLDADLLPDARTHADEARAKGMNQRRLWLLYAELETRTLGDTEAGRTAQREALRRAAVADPDPAWHCDVCGTAVPQWRPVCPNCQTPGRMTWGSPRFLPASIEMAQLSVPKPSPPAAPKATPSTPTPSPQPAALTAEGMPRRLLTTERPTPA
jgi:HemY protein